MFNVSLNVPNNINLECSENETKQDENKYVKSNVTLFEALNVKRVSHDT